MAEKKNDNLRYYEQLRKVPKEAIKTIQAGRLKGMSDINPMWRIKAMTDAFGVCGIGWKYDIIKQWQEQYGQEIKAFCNINLFVKVDGEWSDPIPGLGGSSVMTYEKNGYYVSDEADKMALTDAMGVAMKALGVAADVYWQKGQFDSKYDQQAYVAQQQAAQSQQQAMQVLQGYQQPVYQQQPVQQPMQQPQVTAEQVMAEIQAAQTLEEVGNIYNKYPQWQQDANFTGALTARKDQIKNNGKS